MIPLNSKKQESKNKRSTNSALLTNVSVSFNLHDKTSSLQPLQKVKSTMLQRNNQEQLKYEANNISGETYSI